MPSHRRPRGPKPQAIVLTQQQQQVLEEIVRRETSPQREVRRAQILLHAATGQSNLAIAHTLGLRRETVRRWRERWASLSPRLSASEAETSPGTYQQWLRAILADAERPGSPGGFSAEQVCQIVALACETPGDSARPVSHWTPTELAAEAIKRGIVTTISPRSVARFLKSGRVEATPLPVLAQ